MCCFVETHFIDNQSIKLIIFKLSNLEILYLELPNALIISTGQENMASHFILLSLFSSTIISLFICFSVFFFSISVTHHCKSGPYFTPGILKQITSCPYSQDLPSFSFPSKSFVCVIYIYMLMVLSSPGFHKQKLPKINILLSHVPHLYLISEPFSKLFFATLSIELFQDLQGPTQV